MQPDLTAWYDYFLARKKRLDAAWASVKASYKSLRQVRADLHLPFIDSNDANAWTAELDQDAVDLQYGVHLLLSAADDVLAGRRKVGWDDTRKEFFIERLPVDKIRVDARAGRPVLVNIDTGADTRMSGTLAGTVILGTGLTDLAFFSAFIAAESEAARLGSIADQKTLSTLTSYRQTAVSTGLTDEQATIFSRAITDGAKGVYEECSTKLANAGNTSSGSGNGDISTGEKILLASVIVSVIGLMVKIWSEIKKPEKVGATT